MRKFIGFFSALTLAVAASAAPLLYNTGVDAFGMPQPDDAIESHFTLVGYPNAYVATASGGYPIGPWLGDNSISAWITPTTSTYDAAGFYTYRTTFSLSALQAASFTLAGRWSTDDPGTDILVNGTSTGITAAGFTTWTGFTLNSGFVPGVNSLDFVVYNAGGPTGLRVEFENVPSAPEAGSVALLFGGAMLATLSVRRFRR